MAKKQSRVQTAEKAVKRPDVRVGYTISYEADRKIKAASLETGRGLSDLANEALLERFGGYYVGYRAPNGGGDSGESEPVA